MAAPRVVRLPQRRLDQPLVVGQHVAPQVGTQLGGGYAPIVRQALLQLRVPPGQQSCRGVGWCMQSVACIMWRVLMCCTAGIRPECSPC
jgi:hypothetical protein